MHIFANPLQGELWIQEAFHQSTGQNLSVNNEEWDAVQQIHEDARWIFSGMIYGFDVLWIPSARSRNIAEVLELSPKAMISQNDPAMRLLYSTQDKDFVYFVMEYRPDHTQLRRIRAWQRAGNPVSGGNGVSMAGQQDSRQSAVREAIKNSIHTWLRARVFNKPQEIRGHLALVDFPVFNLMRSDIRATVRVSMEFEAVKAYTID